MFFLIVHRFHDEWIVIGPYWIFTALVIVATFIDFDHFIIPDEITWGCVGAGVLSSLAVPQLMGEHSRWLGLLWSVVGAGVGYLTLWGVVEAGKIAFGKKRVVLPQAQDFVWKRQGEQDAAMHIGTETELWSEYFQRKSDELVLRCDRLTLAGHEHADAVLRCFYNRVEFDGGVYPLDTMEEFSGTLREYVFPREAMGFGDVKFIAGIGAFSGLEGGVLHHCGRLAGRFRGGGDAAGAGAENPFAEDSPSGLTFRWGRWSGCSPGWRSYAGTSA